MAAPDTGATPTDLNDPAIYVAILSGDIDEDGLDNGNSYHVVMATNSSTSTRLEGVTVTGGYATDLAGSVASADCYDDDLDVNPPGAMPPTKAGGGGMECVNSDLQIRNCIFSDNHSTAGGGLRLLCNSDPLIVNCRFENNQVVQGTNTPPNWPGSGGGIYMYGACSPKLFNCVFKSNHADHMGGGVGLQQVGSPEFTQCIFHGNDADDFGGGMRTGFECSPALYQCTFYANEAGSDGGGFSANRDDPPDDGVVTVKSCILWDNIAPDGHEISIGPNGGPVTTVSYSDVEGGEVDVEGDVTWGDGNFDLDPQFINTSTGDFRLAYASPCLNNGDETNLPDDAADLDADSNVSEDLPKDAGILDRQVNPSDCVDAGAHENQVEETCTGDITGSSGVPDGTVNSSDMSLVVARLATPGGVADLYPTPCGDTYVDIDDYWVVINNWGSCGGGFSEEDPPTVGEQIDMLIELLEAQPELTDQILLVIEALGG